MSELETKLARKYIKIFKDLNKHSEGGGKKSIIIVLNIWPDKHVFTPSLEPY